MSSTVSHPRKRNPATKAKTTEECPICEESPAESKRKGQNEAMLSCLTCGETYHVFRCLKLKYAKLEIIKEKGWHCEGHKKCEKCRLKVSTKKNQLLFCDICDVAWHMGCLPEQYDKIPEGVWACHDCLNRNPNVRKEQQRLNKLRKRVQDGEDGEESPSSKRRKVSRNRRVEPVKRTKAELEQGTKRFFDLYYVNKEGPRTLWLAELFRTLSSLDSECLEYIKSTIGGDTLTEICRASDTAFLPEDRDLFDKFTEVNNDKDKCEQDNAAWYEDLHVLVSRMSTPMQEYIKLKVGDVIWSRLILLSLPTRQNRSVNGFEVDGVNVSDWDLVPKLASSPCTQCIESGSKCEYVREVTDTPGCRQCAFGAQTTKCDVKPVYQTTAARHTRGSTLVPVSSVSSVQKSPKNKRKRKAKPPQAESGPSTESISQVASGSRNVTELPLYTVTSAHGLSTPHRRRSSASPVGARERYSVSPPRAQSAAPPSFSPVSPQREKIVDHDAMTTPRQNSEWPITHLPPSPQLSVSPSILPTIQPLPQHPLSRLFPFSTSPGLYRPFQLSLFSSQPRQQFSLPLRPTQPELFSRHASPPPPPTRQPSLPPPPTRQVSVPRQPLTPPSSHSSAEDMDHNSGSVVSSSSHVDPYLEREVVRKDREIARKDAELAELRTRLQQAEAQFVGPRDTDLLAKEKILDQRLLQVDAREQELEKRIKKSEEEAARLEAEKRDFERDRKSWVQEKDAQKEVVKNLIGQLAHAQSQML